MGQKRFYEKHEIVDEQLFQKCNYICYNANETSNTCSTGTGTLDP